MSKTRFSRTLLATALAASARVLAPKKGCDSEDAPALKDYDRAAM